MRIALDVIAELRLAGSVAPRSSDGPTLDKVVISSEGRASLSEIGDLTGAAVLVWEILAARSAPPSPVPRLHDVVDEVHPDVDETLEHALDPDAESMSAEDLSAQLTSMAEGVTATHAAVAAQLLSATPRLLTPRPPPAPTSAPRDQVFDEAWDLPEQAADQTRIWEATVKKHAEERAAAVRASAAEVRAKQVEREKAEEQRLAQVAEDAKAAAALRSAQDAKHAEKVEENLEALDQATTTTARILTGTLADRDSSELDPGTVLLIQRDDSVAEAQLADAIEAAGYTLIVRRDAIAALDALAWVQPICIVCDYDLKDASGDSVARRLRKKGSEVSLTPFLLLASPTDTRTGVSRFAMGADVCMLKPYKPGEVVAQIRALVGMAKRLRAARSALPRLEPTRRTGFAGDLVQMSIAAVLTVLELEHRTGIFEVASDAGEVTLDVVGGVLMRGAAGGAALSPIGALRVMISRKTGKFSFKPGRVWPSAEGGISITAALDAALRFERTGTPVWTTSSVPPKPVRAEDTAPPKSGIAVRDALTTRGSDPANDRGRKL